jgi:hypothetical protein
MTRAELVRQFEIAFDEGFLRKLALHIHNGYADAWEQAAGLDDEFKRHAIPQIRHYVIQTRIRHVAGRSRRIKASIDLSPTGTEPYTVLQSDNFYLSISMVKVPGQLPRQSDFRKANSEDNLFSRIEPHEDKEHYAILTHIPSWDNKEPTHLSVIFPNGDYSGVYEAIDYTALIDFDLDQSKTPSERIDKPEPKLRKMTRKKKKKGA